MNIRGKWIPGWYQINLYRRLHYAGCGGVETWNSLALCGLAANRRDVLQANPEPAAMCESCRRLLAKREASGA